MIAKIEKAIISTIKASCPGFKTVGSWAGDIEDKLLAMTSQMPAAFVLYAGSDNEYVDGPTHHEIADFMVMLCVKSLRNDGSERTAMGGAYAMRKELLEALANQNFGDAEIDRLRPGKTQLMKADQGLVIYAINFHTGFDVRYNW